MGSRSGVSSISRWLISISKKTFKLFNNVTYPVVMALLIFELALPVHLQADPPKDGEQASEESKPTPPAPAGGLDYAAVQYGENQTTTPQDFRFLPRSSGLVGAAHPGDNVDVEDIETQLRKAMARTAAVNEDDVELRLADPYFQVGQNVEVVSEAGTQTFVTDQENLDFPELDKPFDLHKDVVASFDAAAKKLTLSISSVDGVPLKQTYRRNIYLPGVRKVIKDQQFLYIIRESGDIYSVFLAHSHLFKANARARGGNLLVGYVGEVNPKFLDETGRLKQDVDVSLYDSRVGLTKGKDIGALPFNLLRYGDLAVTQGTPAPGTPIDEIITMASIWDAESFHVDHISKTAAIFSGEKDALEVGIDLAAGQSPESGVGKTIVDKTFGGKSPAEITTTTPGISPFMGLTAHEWKQYPTEDRTLGSSNVDALKHLVATRGAYAKDPYLRPTFNTQLSISPEEFNKTLEAQVSSLQAQITPGKAKRSVLKRGMDAARDLTSYMKSRAVKFLKIPAIVAGAISTGIAYNNGDVLTAPQVFKEGVQEFGKMAISLMPEAWVVFDAWHLQKLFDIGILQGPEVWWWSKMLAVSVVVGAGIMLAPYTLFARFDKKVLGRELRKDTFYEASVSGLKVYYTVALRLFSRILKSQRSNIARLVGVDDVLQAIRSGILPSDYKALIDGAKSSNPLIVQERMHQGSAIASHATILVLLTELRKSGKIGPNDDITSFDALKAKLSAPELKLLTDRASLINATFWNHIEAKMMTKGHLFTEAEVKETYSELTGIDLSRVCDGLVERPLSKDERATLKIAANKKQLLNIFMRWAGQDQTYYEFRRAEVPDNVVRQALGWNSFLDLIAQVPCTIISPGFADMKNTGMLAVTESGVAGIMSPKLLVEIAHNGIGWAENTPHEVWNWALKAAGSINSAYINPQLDETTSSIQRALEGARVATMEEQEDLYLKGYSGLNLLYGMQKMGERITGAEVRGLKISALIGTLLTFYGYASDFPWKVIFKDTGIVEALSTFGNVIGALSWDGFAKTITGTGAAYLAYRYLWPWHNLGNRESDGKIGSDKARLGSILSNLLIAYEELITAKSLIDQGGDLAKDGLELREYHSGRLKKGLEQIANWCAEKGKPLPDELNITKIEQSLDNNLALSAKLVSAALEAPPVLKVFGSEEAEQAVAAAAEGAVKDVSTELLMEKLVETTPLVLMDVMNDPRAPMASNPIHRSGTTWGVGIATTVLGLTAFGYIWQIAGGMGVIDVGKVMFGLYGFGQVLQTSMRMLRSKLGYVNSLRTLREVLERPSFNADRPEDRRDAYKAIHEAINLYAHFENQMGAVNPNDLNADQKDIWQTGKRVLEYMIAHPPADPTILGYGGIGREAKKQGATPLFVPKNCAGEVSNASRLKKAS